MKYSRQYLFLAVFGLLTPAFGQPAPPPAMTTGTTTVVHQAANITPAESQEIARTYLAALKANPALQGTKTLLDQRMRTAQASGQPPDEAWRKDELAYQRDLHAAMVKLDPHIDAILEKMGTKRGP